MMRKSSLLPTYNFTLLLQKFCNSNVYYLTKKSALETNSVQLLHCIQIRLFSNKHILGYLENINLGLVQNIPSQYMSITNRTSDLYLTNKAAAEQFVSLIQDELLKNLSYVIEVNPGLGLITQKLLNNGVPFVHIYEKEVKFYDMLKKLHNKFPNKISLTNADLFNLSRLMYVENYNSYSYDLLKFVQQKKWNEESCMQIIGTINRPLFLRHLILSAVFRTCFMMYGRPTFYLAILPSIWDKFTGTNNVLKPSQIMFETIFDYHILGEVDKKAFILWRKHNKKNSIKTEESISTVEKNKCGENLSVLYIVKIEPKREIPVMCCDKQDLIYFWYFVRHHFYKSTIRVIPSLEKLVPGCGIRLIAKDLNVFTQFSDLNIKEVQDLFVEFRCWPEFKESIFTSDAADIIKTYNNYIQAESDDHIDYISSKWTEDFKSEKYDL